MCGDNIYTAEECRDKGFNMSCVAEIFSKWQLPSRGEHLHFDNKGDGSGNNEILDPSGNQTWVWAYDTLRPYYRMNMSNLGSTHVGSRKISNYKKGGDGLATWFQNLELLLTDSRYDCRLLQYGDCWNYCEKSTESD